LYIYTPEVYPTVLRTTGAGMSAVFTRLAGTITPLCGAPLLKLGTIYACATYGGALMICGVCSFLLPIETLGRDLQDNMTSDAGLTVEKMKEKKSYESQEIHKSTMVPLIDKSD
jgi:hypothetical protein